MGWCALCIHPSILILETPKPNLNCQLARFEVSLFSDHKSIFAQISWIFSLLGEASLHLSLSRFHVTLLRTSLVNNETNISQKLPTLASFFSSGYWQAIVDVKSRTCGVKLEREVWQGAPDCLVQTGLFVQTFVSFDFNIDFRWGELDKETVQERLNFDLVTRKLLACLEPVVMAEQVPSKHLNWNHWNAQEFCVAFFKMDSKLGEERPGGRVVAARTKKQVSLKFIMTNLL